MIDSFDDQWGRETQGLIAQAVAELREQDQSDVPEFDSWNEIVQYLMLRHGKTLSTAESCTGGYMASQLTEVPGSSGYFLGSVVAYANSVKKNVLQVSSETLTRHGAVSAQCAEEMLAGVLEVMQSDIGVAVTGIAGPGGGSPAKPVGTVFVSVGDRNSLQTVRLSCERNRKGVVEYTYHRAMHLLYRFLTAQENN